MFGIRLQDNFCLEFSKIAQSGHTAAPRNAFLKRELKMGRTYFAGNWHRWKEKRKNKRKKKIEIELESEKWIKIFYYRSNGQSVT